MRLVLIILLLIVMLVSFGYGLSRLLAPPQGITEISADSASGLSLAGELTFRYDLTGLTTADRKQLTLLYTQAAKDAYELFHPTAHFDGRVNLHDLSASPGEFLRVDPALSEVLSRCVSSGSRQIYLAPLYEVLSDLFFAQDDTEAMSFDPAQDEETRSFFREIASYTNDPDHISLELSADGSACLHISDEYRAFAEEYGITDYLDFYWMKNAFAIDLIAGVLEEKGYTKGILTSRDGFARNLDGSGNDYTMTLYYRKDGQIYTDTDLHLAEPFSSAALYSYPLSDGGYTDRYYTWRDGRVTTGFIDPSDGMEKTAFPELILISKEHTVSDLALYMSKYFIADEPDTEGLSALLYDGIWSIWWEDGRMLWSGYYKDEMLAAASSYAPASELPTLRVSDSDLTGTGR